MKTFQEIKSFYYSTYTGWKEKQLEIEEEKKRIRIDCNKFNLICDDCGSLFTNCTCPVSIIDGENHKTEQPINYDYIDDDFPREKIVLNFGNLNRP